MEKIAIFASGRGSNALKIIEHFEGSHTVSIGLIVTNKKNAGVLDIAKEQNIPFLVIDRKKLYTYNILLKELQEKGITFVVLAGFLLLIPQYLIDFYNKRMINIHPALLPKYGGKGMYGMHVHEAVKKAREQKTGITIHYVNAQFDEGEIIFQATCSLTDTDTPDDIAQKIHQLEHAYYPKVVESVLTGIAIPKA